MRKCPYSPKAVALSKKVSTPAGVFARAQFGKKNREEAEQDHKTTRDKLKRTVRGTRKSIGRLKKTTSNPTSARGHEIPARRKRLIRFSSDAAACWQKRVCK